MRQAIGILVVCCISSALIACTPMAMKVGTASLSERPQDVYAAMLGALSAAGVVLTTTDGPSMTASGTYTDPLSLSGGKPLHVLLSVAETSTGASVRLQATLAQLVDYGATARLIRQIEAAARLQLPGVVFAISDGKAPAGE